VVEGGGLEGVSKGCSHWCLYAGVSEVVAVAKDQGRLSNIVGLPPRLSTGQEGNTWLSLKAWTFLSDPGVARSRAKAGGEARGNERREDRTHSLAAAVRWLDQRMRSVWSFSH
jgi:hypothetical protein